MSQYARELPVDKNNNPYIVSTPNFVSNAAWASVFTISSTVGLNDKTTAIQVTAVGAAVQLRWGNTSISSTNFDAVIPANTAQMFVVPQSIIAVNNSVMGANGANGLYNKVSFVTVGGNVGSVFGAEY